MVSMSPVLYHLAGLLSIIICPSIANVYLQSSSTTLCPGGTVVFTCVTDTGRLIWTINDVISQSFHSPAHLNMAIHNDIFTLLLHNITGESNNTYHSTVTATNVSLAYNETVTLCSDGPNAFEEKNIVTIEGPPSSPLNFSVANLSLSYATISWVAPLDTPLCVHSYTVTVRNSCNNSQVMVYNTTDNRSSLNITDLTSDGVYSVTVAGKDGAGRFGQESGELSFCLKVPLVHLLGYTIKHTSVIIQWKLKEEFCYSLVYYLITHNVSSDQSPITVNRTNVTLYGVQPGETYTVEITPYILCTNGDGSSKKFTFTVLQSIASFVSDSTLVKATFSQTPKLRTVSPHQPIPLAIVVVPCILLVVDVTVPLFCCLCCLQKGITTAKLKEELTCDIKLFLLSLTSAKSQRNKNGSHHTENKSSESMVINDQKDSQESASGTEKEWETKLTEERIYEEVTNVVSPSFAMQSNVAYATVGHT